MSFNTSTDTSSSTLRLHDRVYLHELRNILLTEAVKMRLADPSYSDPAFVKVIDQHFWEIFSYEQSNTDSIW